MKPGTESSDNCIKENLDQMSENDPISRIEDIVLQDDIRGMTALKPHMPANYMEACADLLLDNPGKVFIVTGFYIMAAVATETDGPPGAVAIGNALAKLGNEVAYITDELSSKVVRSLAQHEVIEFPITNHFESANFANELVQEHSPSTLIAIERARTRRRRHLPQLPRRQLHPLQRKNRPSLRPASIFRRNWRWW